MTAATRGLHLVQPERRVGLVVRVSTDHQARNHEGSLTTQLQRLREHLRYKQEVVGEDWEEVEVYELRGISGKNSIRSAEFERLFEDIRTGRVNTVACTSLDRICRSVSDFLHFFEFLSEHDAQFVCLKQQYDTTSPQGRLFVTIMMALAQFEREQTAERTRDATLARAERGLWNGGRLLGYDLDPEQKGYLVPNPDEAAIVNFAFETYLRVGSIAETAAEMNRRGYRTKAYTSRRGIEHPGREFSYTSVQQVLKNPAYIGKKLIDARGDRRTVDAVWPGIVEPEIFERVQQLLAVNKRTSHSQARKSRHTHILSGGLLQCGRCGEPMQGRSGTGKHGKVYFYYACTNGDCRLRVVAPEVEEAVVSRIGVVAADEATVATLVEKANAVLQKQRPQLEKRLRSLQRSLRKLDVEADATMRALGRATPETAKMLNEKLGEIAGRRQQLESCVLECEQEIGSLARATVTADEVRDGLREFGRAFVHLQPYEQKELIRLIIRRVEVGDRELVLEIYGNAVGAFAQNKTNPGVGFVEAPIWLPGSAARSVLVDRSSYRASSSRRAKHGTLSVAERAEGLIESGVVITHSEAAHRLGVTRAAVTMSTKRLNRVLKIAARH